MTTKEYIITGMTCQGCVTNVDKRLSELEEVDQVKIQLDHPQAVVTLSEKVSVQYLQDAIGHYSIQELDNQPEEVELAEKSVSTYKPLILIVSFIFGVSTLVQYPFDTFSWMLWMNHFMAGFFLVFSFFKLLNLRGFANSYAMYDIVAAKFKVWGYIYPFVELGLGIAYLLALNPLVTNITALVVMGVSTIGVIQSNLQKKKIKCACLGDVFNLPMSTVTIIEDLTMVAMAAIMILQLS